MNKVRVRRKSVFLVHGYETYNGKHNVHFGSDFNRKGNTKQFKRISDAKKFAEKKAIEQGNRNYLADLPSGTKTIRVKRKK